MEANRVIATAGIVSVAVGTVNSIGKNKRLPSTRFLIGSGVAFLTLSALAEAEPELAKALAVAVTVTVVLGDGGGVLSYINDRGEIDTQKKTKNHDYTPDINPDKSPPTNTNYGAGPAKRYVVPSGLSAFPGLPNLTPRPQG